MFLLAALLTFVVSHLRIRSLATSLQRELFNTVINSSANGEIAAAIQAIDQLVTLGVPTSLTDTLRGVAHSIAGECKTAVEMLEPLAESADNKLATCALCWTYYDAGSIAEAVRLFGELRDLEAPAGGNLEADLTRFFLARLRMYASHDAYDDAIEQLSDVLARNRRRIEEDENWLAVPLTGSGGIAESPR